MSPLRRIFPLLAVCLLSLPTAVRAADAIKGTDGSFDSGGKRIAVEWFRPAGDGPFPCVLVIHGADGLQLDFITKFYRDYARHLARHGYAALFVHYMDGSTGKKVVDFKEITTN